MPIFRKIKRKSRYISPKELKEKWWNKLINSLNLIFSFMVFSCFLVIFFDNYSRSIFLSFFFSIIFSLISFFLIWFIYRKIIIFIIFGKKPENFKEETVLITKKLKTNWNYLFLIIIFSFMVIVTLLFLISYYQIEPKIDYNKNIQKEEPINWLIYENKEHFYQIKYPENWEINEEEESRTFFYLDELNNESVKMFINVQGYKFFNDETIKEINEDKNVVHIEEVVINEYPGHKIYRQEDKKERPLIFYTIAKDKFVFIILIYELDLIEEIISTFEFLE